MPTETRAETATEELPHIENFYLKRRDDKPDGILYLHEYDADTGRAPGYSLRTRDVEAAKPILYKAWLEKGKPPENAEDALVLDIMNRYFNEHGNKTVSARSANYSRKYVADHWPALKVSELDPDGQKKIVRHMRKQTRVKKTGEIIRRWSDNTILYYLNFIWAALNYGAEETWLGKQVVPEQLRTSKWDAEIEGRKRLLEDREVGALFEAAGAHWERTGDPSRWYYMLQAVGLIPRPRNPLKTRPCMIKRKHRTIDLLPPGKKPSKTKRYAVVKLCDTLWYWLVEKWEDDERYFCAKLDGKPMGSMTFFFDMRDEAGLDAGVIPYLLRHYGSTCCIEEKVSEVEKDIAMGHAKRGSRTGAGYVHDNPAHPEYLGGFASAMDRIFERVQNHCRYRIVPYRISDDQPLPDALPYTHEPLVWGLTQVRPAEWTPPPASSPVPGVLHYKVDISRTAPQSLHSAYYDSPPVQLLTEDPCSSPRSASPSYSVTYGKISDTADTEEQ